MIWDDTHIQPGSEWNSEIIHAIEKASVAILLITSNFFASDFIMNEELPRILRRQKRGELKVIPLHASPVYMKDHKLLSLQGLNDPDEPIEGMSELNRQNLFVTLVDLLAAEIPLKLGRTSFDLKEDPETTIRKHANNEAESNLSLGETKAGEKKTYNTITQNDISRDEKHYGEVGVTHTKESTSTESYVKRVKSVDYPYKLGQTAGGGLLVGICLVSNELFKSFLNETPYWLPNGNCLADGAVDENYLAHWENGSYIGGKGNLPITNISYYAAEAFTVWIGAKMKLQSARMFTLTEWKTVAKAGRLTSNWYIDALDEDGEVNAANTFKEITEIDMVGPNSLGFFDLLGNVYEFCSGTLLSGDTQDIVFAVGGAYHTPVEQLIIPIEMELRECRKDVGFRCVFEPN